jgi:hypothetical protein
MMSRKRSISLLHRGIPIAGELMRNSILAMIVVFGSAIATAQQKPETSITLLEASSQVA